MHAQRWQRLRKLCRASMRRALLLPRRSRRAKRGGNARGADAPSRSAARFAMRYSEELRAATDNALAFMASVGSARARDIPPLHAEPERAKRMLIKLALMRMTAESGEGSTRGRCRAVLGWLCSFDCAVRPALLGTIAQAAAAALTPERVAEPGRELLASVADAFAHAGHERTPGVAHSTCASSRRRERSADAPRHASAGKNLGHRELHGPKAVLPI